MPALAETRAMQRASAADRSRRVRRDLAGLSAVEVAVIVSVIGVLLAVAIPTLAKAIRTSKVAEASEQLELLYQRTASYYATPRINAGGERVHCLPPAAGPTPAKPSPDPVVVDFTAPDLDGAETWKALGFAPAVRLRYRYSFLPSASGCGLEAGELVLRAEGDLDGDGTYSRFERRAQLRPDGQLAADPVLHIRDRIE